MFLRCTTREKNGKEHDAQAPPEKTLESALRITENETQYQSVADQNWRGEKRGRTCLRIDRFKVTHPGRSKTRKPKTKRPNAKKPKAKLNFNFRVNRAKFRETYRREGQYLLRGYLAQQAPATLWEYYTQLTEIEEAFKNLKGDIGIR